MASERQIAANRENALKSTGPVTQEGRTISSLNSCRHGLLARTVVLDGESTERFQDLLTSLTEELQPESRIETILVENMTVACWGQRRIWGMHRAGLCDEVHNQGSGPNGQETVAKKADTRMSLAFRSIADNSRSLDLMNRYLTSYERQYERAYRRLLDIQEKRKTREKDDFSKRTQFSGETQLSTEEPPTT
jgi:hypothetical protein